MLHRRKTEIVQVNLRLREELRRELAKAAEKAGRSLNQELVLRLATSLDLETQLDEVDKRRASAEKLLDQSLEVLRQASALQDRAFGFFGGGGTDGGLLGKDAMAAIERKRGK